MPQFQRIEIWSKLQCELGATRLGVLYDRDLASAKDVLAIDDQESLTFSFPRVDASGATRPIVARLVGRTIATVVWSDGSFDERRVALIEDGRGVGGLITVTANPLLLDLAEGADSTTGKGYISTAGVLRVFSFALASQTATSVWDNYITPACPSWVSRGTIDPTALIPTLNWDRQTPLAVATQVRDALRKQDVSCELRLRRNGTTDYKLDLVTQIGAGASVPLFHPTTSLESLKRKVDTTQQVTRVFVTGQTDPSGLPGIPGRARWLVTNVDTGTKKVTLADPNGTVGPIGMTNQWTGGAVLIRVRTGRAFPIVASDADAQTVTVIDVPTITVGEFAEFRVSEPYNNNRTIQIFSASPSPRYHVNAVGGAAEYLDLLGNPITVDGQHSDWYMRVWTASSGGSIRKYIRITGSTASSDRVTCAAGDAAGVLTTDWVEFVQADGAGELPSYLDHAVLIQAPPAGYGMKCGDLAAGTPLGVTNIQPNSWMRAWSNSANPPDGWTFITGVGAGPTSQNTNPLYAQYGGLSFNIDFKSNVLVAPRVDVVQVPGNSRVSFRAKVFFTAYSVSGGTDTAFALQVYALDASGAPIGGVLGEDRVTALDSAIPNTTKVGTGAWITLEVAGIDLASYTSPYGIVATLGPLSASALATGQCVGYVDTIEAYGFVTNPTDVYEYGDATALHQVGNRQLLSNGAPLVAYELTVADLERSDPVTWARNQLTIGGSVRAVDRDFGTDVTVRLLRLERDLLRPKASTVGLATLPALLTQLV